MGNKAIEVIAPDCLVASDLHIPGHSEYWLRKLIEYGREHNIKKLILAGDTFHFDALSQYKLKDKEMDLDKELYQAQLVLHRLAKYFKVYLVQGNHDSRACIALDDKIDFVAWCRTLFGKEIIVTNYDHMYLMSGNKRWRIAHASAYSKIKGSVASALSHDLGEDIMIGHSHNFAYGTNKTDRYQWVDLGCMCDIDAFDYRNRHTGSFPQWQNGFVHVRQGRVRLIAKGLW